MKSLILAAGLAAAVALGGCGTAGLSARNPDGTSQLLSNLENCTRNYIGTVGGVLPPAVSVSITCQPVAPPAPAKEAAVVPPADPPI